MREVGYAARMVEVRNASLVGKSEGKIPAERPCRRWEDIRFNLKEMVWENDWMHLAQERDQWRAVVNTVIILRVP
jgi:hypothetical protein